MNKKNIKHLVNISLKYFFDFDYAIFDHLISVVVLFIRSLKLIFTGITYEFYDGALTVKEDMKEIKAGIIAYKEHWENSNMREVWVNNIRTLRNSLIDKETHIWRS